MIARRGVLIGVFLFCAYMVAADCPSPRPEGMLYCYGFENWTGDRYTTQGYPYSSGYASFCENHDRANEVVTSYGNWTAHSGDHFILRNDARVDTGVINSGNSTEFTDDHWNIPWNLGDDSFNMDPVIVSNGSHTYERVVWDYIDDTDTIVFDMALPVDDITGWNYTVGHRLVPGVDGIPDGTVNDNGNIGSNLSACNQNPGLDIESQVSDVIFIRFWARNNIGFAAIEDAYPGTKWIRIYNPDDSDVIVLLSTSSVDPVATYHNGDGTRVKLPRAYDGEWHKYSVMVDLANGIQRFWYDVDAETVDNAVLTYDNGGPIADLDTLTGFQLQGNFCATWPNERTYHAVDDIEVWDRLPSSTDTTAPRIYYSKPSGRLPENATEITLGVTTHEEAECRYSASSGMGFNDMEAFSQTGSRTHQSILSGISPGQDYDYYVKCNDSSGNVNAENHHVSFTTSTSAELIYNYSFEDWAGAEYNTSGYPFGEYHPLYWTEHKNQSEILTDCDGWTASSGQYYYYSNLHPNSYDSCLENYGGIRGAKMGRHFFYSNQYNFFLSEEHDGPVLYLRFMIRIDPDWIVNSDGDRFQMVRVNFYDGDDGGHNIYYTADSNQFSMPGFGEPDYTGSVDLDDFGIELSDGGWHEVAIRDDISRLWNITPGSISSTLYIDGTEVNSRDVPIDSGLTASRRPINYYTLEFFQDFSGPNPDIGDLRIGLDDIEIWDGMPGPQEDYHAADTDEDGIISNGEIRAYVGLWREGRVSISGLLSGLQEWKGMP